MGEDHTLETTLRRAGEVGRQGAYFSLNLEREEDAPQEIFVHTFCK